LGFETISNWNYVLQGAASLSGGVVWSNLTLVPAQATNGHAVFVDGVTNQQRFYRLSLSP
jgi:RsiW-degrading membrane proteinase PrsW (M82 family)